MYISSSHAAATFIFSTLLNLATNPEFALIQSDLFSTRKTLSEKNTLAIES
jgi:hypothetical protein